MANEKELVKVLTPYLTAFPECKLDTPGLIVYAKALAGTPAGVVDAAMLKLLHKAKFFPRVSDIVEAVEELGSQAGGGSGAPDAGAAWEEAMSLVKREGYMGKWTFSCPQVEAAVRRFGKMELCRLEEKDVNTARAQFRDIYNAAAGAARRQKENQAILDRIGAGRVAQLVSFAGRGKDMPKAEGDGGKHEGRGLYEIAALPS